MKKFINYLLCHHNLLLAAIWSYVGHFFSDEIYLRVRFRLLMGKWPDLKAPKTFNEKLQWLKLHDRNPEYTKMVDKLAVKEYIAAIIGSEYVIPTLGVWDNPEDIEWEKLPKSFVLKTTHAGGSLGVVICKDKEKLDKKDAVKKLRTSMGTEAFRTQGEWPYKNVPHRILAEVFLEPQSEINDLPDYKFFCFNGEPKLIQLDFDRFNGHKKNLYSTEWKMQPFGFNYPPHPECHFEKPAQLDKMLEIARELSRDKTFIRIDLYWTGNKIYFGEITFYPASGYGKFDPDVWDYKVGELIKLPKL